MHANFRKLDHWIVDLLRIYSIITGTTNSILPVRSSSVGVDEKNIYSIRIYCNII